MKREATLSPPPLKRRKLQISAPTVPASQSTSATPQPAGASPPSKTRTIRIFTWNINGLQPFIPSSAAPITSYFKPVRPSSPSSPSPSSSPSHPPTSLRSFLHRHSFPEVLFLQELKIALASRDRISAALLATLNTPLSPSDEVSPERSYTIDSVLPRDKFNARAFGGKLYGVATLLRTDFARGHVTAVRGVEWDLEGRVGVVEVRPSESKVEEGRGLALINVYAVNGTEAGYKNPGTGKAEGTRHDFKVRFHSRLRDEAMALEQRGFEVVMAGDMNVARGLWDGFPNLRTWPARHCVNRADFNGKMFGRGENERAGAWVGEKEKMEEEREETGEKEEEGKGKRKCFDGVDVFRAMHGDERRYTWHSRTREWGTCCDRVDMIIVSKRLWEEGRVRATDILDTPQERGPSDHVPLWVEVALG